MSLIRQSINQRYTSYDYIIISINQQGVIMGVTYCKRLNKWKAQVKVQGKRINLGYYESWDNAYDAYVNADKTMLKLALVNQEPS